MKLFLTALSGLLLCLVAGCGDTKDTNDLPSGVIAKVGKTEITKADVGHYLDVYLRGSRKGMNPRVPGNMAKCLRERAIKEPQYPPKEIARRCRVDFVGQDFRAARILIRGEWLSQEAKRRGMDLSDTALERSLESSLRKVGIDHQKLVALRKQQGLTKSDQLMMWRLQQLDQLVKPAAKTSDAEVQSFYDRNKSEFVRPEHRDIYVVVNKSRKGAVAARKALKGGSTWRAVAARYATARVPGDVQGRVTLVAGQLPVRSFGRTVFAASVGTLVGPIKVQGQWYVLSVRKVKPRLQSPLASVRSEVRRTLIGLKQDDAYTKRYGAVTTCLKKYQIPEVPECLRGKGPRSPLRLADAP